MASVFSISMGPMKPSGPSHGALQAHGPPKLYGLLNGPLKFTNPRVIVPPSRRPWSAEKTAVYALLLIFGLQEFERQNDEDSYKAYSEIASTMF